MELAQRWPAISHRSTNGRRTGWSRLELPIPADGTHGRHDKLRYGRNPSHQRTEPINLNRKTNGLTWAHKASQLFWLLVDQRETRNTGQRWPADSYLRKVITYEVPQLPFWLNVIELTCLYKQDRIQVRCYALTRDLVLLEHQTVTPCREQVKQGSQPSWSAFVMLAFKRNQTVSLTRGIPSPALHALQRRQLT